MICACTALFALQTREPQERLPYKEQALYKEKKGA